MALGNPATETTTPLVAMGINHEGSDFGWEGRVCSYKKASFSMDSEKFEPE